MSDRMPTLFVAHGAPFLAVDQVKGAPYQAWGRALPRPKAILVVSAHWEHTPPLIGATETLPLLYDYYGFPDELYQITYPAPGAPDLAKRVAALLAPHARVTHHPKRALDHGAFIPLLHLFPQADVPVLQLALGWTNDPAGAFRFGQWLAPLREEGVLIIGSGNITHNLRQLDVADLSPPPSWASEFDQWTAESLNRWDIDQLLDYRRVAPGVSVALPTHEHFVPLLVVAGAASLQQPTISYPVAGFEYGSLSRRSVQMV